MRGHRLDTSVNTAPESPVWSQTTSEGFRRSEVSTVIDHGEECWERATHDVLRWAIKTRSGFQVSDSSKVSPGTQLTVTARVAGITVIEPITVVRVVEEPDRVGFSYRTRPGHPVTGEEAFIVHRTDTDVILTVRSLTAPSDTQPWRALYPFLRIVQVVAHNRYLRALR
jgi:uncharacterized protein (UPF0548 family)